MPYTPKGWERPGYPSMTLPTENEIRALPLSDLLVLFAGGAHQYSERDPGSHDLNWPAITRFQWLVAQEIDRRFPVPAAGPKSCPVTSHASDCDCDGSAGDR